MEVDGGPQEVMRSEERRTDRRYDGLCLWRGMFAVDGP